MNSDLDKLRLVFQRILKCDPGTVNERGSMETIDGWDSLVHLRLVMEIESAFKMKFKTSELASLTTIKAILDQIPKK